MAFYILFSATYSLTSHLRCVNSLAWNGPTIYSNPSTSTPLQTATVTTNANAVSLSLSSLLASGSKDGMIYIHDPSISVSSASPSSSPSANGLSRDPRAGLARWDTSVLFRIAQHTREVAGLAWNADKTLLASGGSDDRVYIWDIRLLVPASVETPEADNIGLFTSVHTIQFPLPLTVLSSIPFLSLKFVFLSSFSLLSRKLSPLHQIPPRDRSCTRFLSDRPISPCNRWRRPRPSNCPLASLPTCCFDVCSCDIPIQ